jgi:diadenosine tetraphosphate (Ap4A) HIT family hydrolase
MFCDKFNPETMTLKEFKHWIVVLRPKQQTLGDAVIILKNEHSFIGEASCDEFAEFPQVVAWYEEKCKKLFGAEKFNYLAAMMKDNFVHFHAFPRYSSQKNYCGITWEDVDWPRPVTPGGVVPADEVVKSLLADFRD